MVFVNGTVGSGKSTTAQAIGAVLAEQGVAHGLVDLDALRRAWPAPPGDPFHNALELENLAAVAANYRRVGAQRLVLAGVLEQPALRGRYAAAVGGVLAVVRLDVAVTKIQERLRQRHAGDGEALAWHLERCAQLHAILAAAGGDDAVVEATGLDRRQAAEAVIAAVGWSS